MNQRQETAKTEINNLAIELIALVNQKDPYSQTDITTIKNIALRMRYETNDLNDYEAFEQVLGISK